mmetsp:Transcript_18543/g.36381  ORF Transcript_18543/g.36381 Transcript_18543/m.36381 type:complete len:314 (-) Transcript_18543:49-990(-)|eukprot:CAMPEP_0172723194 /NCGR_PEP_ID=MMETSP1074-20121228/83231_1 /TAXON_ID=2916 /ORGANISM="Ceratium fusus, Strain PA161109" /LENGTH=313 /DNA_ID=CAMNT_0013549395 /DNA_START=46 /DNA_END=987 /DNA_ORIENTATION=-
MAASQDTTDEGFVDISPCSDRGLLKKVLVEGTSDETPPEGSSVDVHYVGTLHSDGSKFDSSRDRPGTFQFDVGVGQVIKGWDIGICSMRRGEKCILRCRSDFAYGESGHPPTIPGGATLDFEVELFSWKEKVPEPGEMDDAERKAYAMKMKEAGNEAFKAKDYATAINRYDDGAHYITFDPNSQPCSGHHGDGDEGHSHSHGPERSLSDDEKKLALALLNNCANARLKMDDALGAKFDCCKALKYDKDNVKAVFRLAESELALGNFAACVDGAGRVLELDPMNKEAEQLRRKGLAATKSAKEKEKAMCSKMFG